MKVSPKSWWKNDVGILRFWSYQNHFWKGYKIEVWNIKIIFIIFIIIIFIIIFIFIFIFITKCENSNMIMGNDVKSSLKLKKQFAPINNTWNRNADFK